MERFEGVQFDWYPFVRDGQPCPLPDPRDQPPQEIFLEPTGGGAKAPGKQPLEAQRAVLIDHSSGNARLSRVERR